MARIFLPAMAMACGAALAESPAEQTARARFAAMFPNTRIDDFRCDGFGPLCQVVAGVNILYVDPRVEHIFVGHVFDIDERRDLTAAALSPPAPAPAPGGPGLWAALPFESAIVRNPGAHTRVAVFSDVNCGHCRRLSLALEEVTDLQVSEFLIGRGDSEALGNAIACASRPAAALQEWFLSGVRPAADCARDIVSPATRAADIVGVRGTPTFIRPDGARMSGFRDLRTLRAWLAETRPTADAREGTP